MKVIKNEEGIAIILALLMLLVMSIMAVTASFISNSDFRMMSVHKSGQEAFLASETCVTIAKRRLEEIGAAPLFLKLQSAASNPDPTTISTLNAIVILENMDPQDDGADVVDWLGPLCRSGPRIWDSASQGPGLFINIPEATKSNGRPVADESVGQATTAITVPFNVMGKASKDKDKDDTDPEINTGTELEIGIEVFVVGATDPIYSSR